LMMSSLITDPPAHEASIKFCACLCLIDSSPKSRAHYRNGLHGCQASLSRGLLLAAVNSHQIDFAHYSTKGEPFHVSVKSDRWILQMCRESGMIKPFEARLVREVEGRRIISAGVSSYGYDLRLAPDGFRVFSPIASAEIDPKNFDENSLIEAPLRVSEDGSQYWLLPPHSYALGVTVETFNMPRNVVGLCMGKCLPGDVRVIDASTGEVVELRTFVEERRKWIGTLNGHRVTAGRVTNHIYSGVKPTYEVTTRSGRVIRATDHHPFLTFGGWLELLNLRVGDRIGVPREIPIFGNKD